MKLRCNFASRNYCLGQQSYTLVTVVSCACKLISLKRMEKIQSASSITYTHPTSDCVTFSYNSYLFLASLQQSLCCTQSLAVTAFQGRCLFCAAVVGHGYNIFEGPNYMRTAFDGRYMVVLRWMITILDNFLNDFIGILTSKVK